MTRFLLAKIDDDAPVSNITSLLFNSNASKFEKLTDKSIPKNMFVKLEKVKLAISSPKNYSCRIDLATEVLLKLYTRLELVKQCETQEDDHKQLLD